MLQMQESETNEIKLSVYHSKKSNTYKSTVRVLTNPFLVQNYI